MYEENNRFSWTNLFIKIIIVIIFILFTVWLLSLSTKNITKGMSDSLGVLTDNIFSQNVDKMKEVGKSYFTTERLPQKVGEIKTLSLARMYDENLILELKDKNGNACSAKNSYVKVEKMETEYRMKIYLECGEESDHVIVIMGCYNYCNTDICEKKNESTVQGIEYQYSKTTGGSWTSYGSWSEWSKTAVSKTNSRDVQTKVVKETYTYDKTVTDSKKVGDPTCPNVDSYTLVSNKDGVCTYNKIISEVTNPETCPTSYNGYTLVKQDGFTCSYSKNTSATANPETCAKTYNGYTLVSQSGFTCNYSKNTSSTVNPTTCASTYNGYNLTSQSGFTCNYSKTTTSTANPASCASTYSGYSLSSQSGFTCYYSKTTTSTVTVAATESRTWIPGTSGTTSCYQVAVGSKLVGGVMQTIYENRCTTSGGTSGYYSTSYSCPSGYTRSGSTCYGSKTSTATTTTTVGCPSGYTKSGSSCVKSSTSTTTTTVGCPSGYTKSGNSCVKGGTATTTTTVGCPSGYTKSGNSCVKGGTTTTTITASCPSGYEKRGTYCVKDNTSVIIKNAVCGTGEVVINGACYKDGTSVQKVTETRNVTYYRYRTRSYTGGTTDYKWSTSNKDTSLLDAGYKLTGKTRTIGGK